MHYESRVSCITFIFMVMFGFRCVFMGLVLGLVLGRVRFMVTVKEFEQMSKIPENKEFDEKYLEWIKSLIEAYGEG